MIGIWMSIRTTSGWRQRTTSSASAPSAASPTTSMSGSVSRILRNPTRTSCWSSTRTTRIGPLMACPPRRRPARAPRRRTRQPASARRPRVPPTADAPLAHARDAHPTAGRASARRVAWRGPFSTDRTTLAADANGATDTTGAAAMAQRVRQRFLGDPVQRELGRRREGRRRRVIETGRLDRPGRRHASARQRSPRSASVGAGGAGARAAGARSGPSVGGAIGLPQGRDQTLHLDDRGATRRLDRAQGRGGLARRPVERPAGGGRLDADEADVVRDHIVQLPGDRQPLLEEHRRRPGWRGPAGGAATTRRPPRRRGRGWPPPAERPNPSRAGGACRGRRRSRMPPTR